MIRSILITFVAAGTAGILFTEPTKSQQIISSPDGIHCPNGYNYSGNGTCEATGQASQMIQSPDGINCPKSYNYAGNGMCRYTGW